VDLLPNSLSFRIVTTLDLDGDADVPSGFTGRARRGYADGTRAVAWYVDGLLDDPSRTVPAYRRYRCGGELKFEMWYRAGLLQDPSTGAPAVRGFYADGTVHYEERFTRGRRHDGPGGAPALRKWRADGTLRHELHYRDGVRLSRAPSSLRAGRSAALALAPAEERR